MLRALFIGWDFLKSESFETDLESVHWGKWGIKREKTLRKNPRCVLELLSLQRVLGAVEQVRFPNALPRQKRLRPFFFMSDSISHPEQ